MSTSAAAVRERPITADDIVALLAARHPIDKAVFVEECKMGASGSRRLDAWALLKTWSPPTTIGYEVKVSRSDFVNDRKWETYLPVCNEFYFACPARLIAVEELPPSVGLLWTAGGRLLTKRKAMRRDVSAEQFIDLEAGSWEVERRLRAGTKEELKRALDRMRSLVDEIERREGLSA